MWCCTILSGGLGAKTAPSQLSRRLKFESYQIRTPYRGFKVIKKTSEGSKSCKNKQKSKVNIISLKSSEQDEEVQPAGKKHSWKKDVHNKSKRHF